MPNCTRVGVAEHDVDIIEGDAELLRDDLREGRLVALAVIVGADQHRHLAGRMHPHGGALVEAAAGAERVRRCATARGRRPRHRSQSPMPRNLPSRPMPPCVRRSPRQSAAASAPSRQPIGSPVSYSTSDRRLIGIGFLGDHVAAADLDAVDAHLAWPRRRPAAPPRRSPPAARRRDRHRPAPCW